MRETLNIPSGKNGVADRKFSVEVTMHYVASSGFIRSICNHMKIDLLYL